MRQHNSCCAMRKPLGEPWRQAEGRAFRRPCCAEFHRLETNADPVRAVRKERLEILGGATFYFGYALWRWITYPASTQEGLKAKLGHRDPDTSVISSRRFGC